MKRKQLSSKAEGVVRPRCVDEAPKPLVCSYCARPAEDVSRAGPWRFEVKRHATPKSRQDMLYTNDGVLWWMRAQGPGEWCRPCWWWAEAHVDGEENGWSILLHRCGRCGVEESIMAEVYLEIADKRAEWERAHPEDEKARVCGICTYCGEVIKAGSTVPRPFKLLFKEFDSLTYCRGVWWMRAHGGNHWRRCYWWDEESSHSPGDKEDIRVKQCLRCGEEEEALDSAIAHMCLAHMD